MTLSFWPLSSTNTDPLESTYLIKSHITGQQNLVQHCLYEGSCMLIIRIRLESFTIMVNKNMIQ